MASVDPLDIASRASNLAERMWIVGALSALGEVSGDRTALDPLDSWKIDRQAQKLAGKFRQEALHRSAPTRYTKDELVKVLIAYRNQELSLREADKKVRNLFADIHYAWLPTYQTALDRFDGTGLAESEAGWRRHEVYYGRAAKACEPFLLELDRELSAVCARDVGVASCRFDQQLVKDVQQHLFERFELSLAWAVEADTNVYCVQAGIDKSRATPEDYLAYLDSTFEDAEAYHRFYLRFPILGRWLAHITHLLIDYGRKLIERLSADTSAISDSFFDQEITAFRGIRLGRSDYHAGGQSVAFVEAELADGTSGTFVYKPRCIRSEGAMQSLLGRLRDDGVLGFVPRRVLPRNGYGYEALIAAGRNRVETQEEAGRIYQELGGYLGLFYVLGGGDLHLENILVADGHAFVCDCETVLGVLPKGQGRPLGTLLDSVFKTGLLEWPRALSPATAGTSEMRISGYSGGEPYDMPIAVPQVDDCRLTFEASVTHRAGVRVEPDPSNRVFVGDRLVQPQDFAEAIRTGFEWVYEWFERQPEEASRCIAETFDGASARFINWGTQVYAQLLMSARHPRCLMDPLEVDLLVNTVRTYPRNGDPDGVLAAHELSSLWQLDVPIFTADVHGNRLVHDHRTQLPSDLDISPLDYAAQRIRYLSARNRVQQSHYIAASLSTEEVRSPSFIAACMDYASRIGQRLCDTLRAPSSAAPWSSYQLTGQGIVEVDVEGDLYNGSAGIALFLAYLDHLAPRPEFRRAAERALAHAIAHCDRQRIGAFSGLSSLVYLLTHLHHLWQDRKLLELALRLSRDLPRQIDDDDRFDVLSGAAGVIPVMLGLAGAADGAGLDHAHRCAEHLVQAAEADTTEALSWPLTDQGEASGNLTGFSHGAAGIGWALISIGHLTGRSEYIEAGRRGFAYEARHFDETEQDWYDLRLNAGGTVRNGRHYPNAWCNGAAGIGLSRITSWALLGKDDELLLREAHQALAATMRNFPRLMNDTLCHGRAGNAELFLRFGKLRDEPAFQLEANVQVQTQWRNVDAAEAEITRSVNFDPGLMIGMSGFGMHFLRLAHPERIPSVLLLDPPARS